MAGQLTVSLTFISVSLRDTGVVDLVNKLPSTTTSIHWHGLYMHGGPVNGESDLYQCEYKGQSGGGPGPSTTTSIHWHGLYMHGWPVNGESNLRHDEYIKWWRTW
jgi:hypothetical protein